MYPKSNEKYETDNDRIKLLFVVTIIWKNYVKIIRNGIN